MDVAISKVFTIVYKLMFVDSVLVFPKFRKQFAHIFILGLHFYLDVLLQLTGTDVTGKYQSHTIGI